MSLSHVIAAITALMLLFGFRVSLTNQQQIIAAEADATARNMLVYRRAVVAYLAANPGASGTIPDASLTLPTWFSKNITITNTINTGIVYIYATNPPPGLVGAINLITSNAGTIGVVSGNVLINPTSTTNLTIPVAIPSSIPNGSAVIVG